MLLDATYTFTILNTDLDVALITPHCAPRIPDKVVLSTIHGPVSHKKYTMIKLSATTGPDEDSATVHLKRGLICFNSYRNGTDSNSSHQSFCTQRFHLVYFGHLNSGLLALIVLASRLLGSVDIVRRQDSEIIFIVFVTNSEITTVATHIFGRAIHKLLL